MRRFFMLLCLIVFFCNISLAQKFSTCSEMWLDELESYVPLYVSLSIVLPVMSIPGVVLGSLQDRQQSKVAHLLESAGILYKFRHKKDYIEPEHFERVRKFYNKYIITDSLKTLKINKVIEILAKYDKIAYGLSKCDYFVRDGRGTTFTKFAVARNIFGKDKINPNIIKDISIYKIRAEKIIKRRQKEINKWDEKIYKKKTYKIENPKDDFDEIVWLDDV